MQDLGSRRDSGHFLLDYDHAELTEIAGWVERFARDNALPQQTAFRLDLVLAEAITNIMDYARPAHEGDGIEMRCVCDGTHIEIELVDGGPGFDPTGKVPGHLPQTLAEAVPGGLGIHLIHAYASRFEYRRTGERNQLHLTLPVNATSTAS